MLFAVVTAMFALFIVDMVRYNQKQVKPVKVKSEWIISPYDEMFQEIGEKYGIDWLLLSAIAYASGA